MCSTNPTISIIVPIYKVERYLNRCVDSILSQTYKDFECILVDDGSPDKCGQLCDEYAAKDARIKAIHKPNGGVSSARNAGLDIAGGGYIAFVDSDDWIHPCYFEYLMRAIEESGAEAATLNNVPKAEYAASPTVSYADIEKKVYSGGTIRTELYDFIFRTDEKEYRDIITCGLYGLYSSRIFEDIRFDSQIQIGEDLEVIAKVSVKLSSVVHLFCPLYYYFTGNESSTRSAFSEKNYTSLTALRNIAQITNNLNYNEEHRKFEYRYTFEFLTMAYKTDRLKDVQMFVKFNAYRLDMKARYKKLTLNHYFTFAQKVCIFLCMNDIKLWKKIFAHIECGMIERLNNFAKHPV